MADTEEGRDEVHELTVLEVDRPKGEPWRIRRPKGAMSLKGVRLVHELILDYEVYENQGRTDQARETAIAYVQDVYLAEMAPRNPVERMLAIQMLWNHKRIGRLIEKEVVETDSDISKNIRSNIVSSMNTFRRQAASWDELRTPRQGRSVQVIHAAGEAHVAQVVTMGVGGTPEESGVSLRNELGGGRDEQRDEVLRSRLGGASCGCEAGSTLGEEHRATDS